MASRQSAVTSPHSADVYKVEAWSRGHVQETPLQREGLGKNGRLGVLVERINYLCSHPRGEGGKPAAGHKKRSTWTTRSEGAAANMWQVPSSGVSGAGRQGRERFEIYYSFSAMSCRQPRALSMTQRMYF